MFARLIFFLSFGLLVFIGSIAMMRFQFFPYPVIRESLVGIQAFWEVISGDQANFLFIDEAGKPHPTVTWAKGYSDDGAHVIVSGGPGALASRCPTFGCVAWITNRRADVLHTWEIDYEALWADLPNSGIKDHNRITPVGVHVFDNGDLLVNFTSEALFPYGVGMAKLDRDARVLWSRANYSHHWFSVAPDGSIYTPAHQIGESTHRLGHTRKSLNCSKGPIYSDVILKLDAEGNTVDTIPLLEVLDSNGLTGTVSVGRTPCDSIHLNHVEYVTEELAAGSQVLKAGDLIFSLRQINMLAVLDPATRKIKWRQQGRTMEQHSPQLLPDGGLIVFDNYGGRKELGGTRVVRVELNSDALSVIYPPERITSGINFFSHYGGVLDLSPDRKRALVSSSQQGHIFEIDLHSGALLWEYINNHDLGAYPRHKGRKKGKASRLWVNGAWYIESPLFLKR